MVRAKELDRIVYNLTLPESKACAMELSKDLEVIATQERELVLPRFDEDIAWELGLRLRELALYRQLPVTIEVRRFGQPLFYSALKGTTPDVGSAERKRGGAFSSEFLRYRAWPATNKQHPCREV
jgi:uncharacterized protein (UPF0303 family)